MKDFLTVFIGAGVFVAFIAGMIYISQDSYKRRKAACKAQGGQWIQAMHYDDSKCIEAAEGKGRVIE